MTPRSDVPTVRCFGVTPVRSNAWLRNSWAHRAASVPRRSGEAGGSERLLRGGRERAGRDRSAGSILAPCCYARFRVQPPRRGRRPLGRDGPASRCEHLLQPGEHLRKRTRTETTKTPDQALAVDSPKLIEDNLPVLTVETACNPKCVRLPTCRERRDDRGSQMGVQLVGRHDEAWAGLLDLAAASRVQSDEEHFPAPWPIRSYHSHSRSSKCVGAPSSTSRSPPRAWSLAASTAQPSRGVERALITIVLPRTSRSTSSCSPACSIKGFGSRRPRELPIRTSFAFMGITMDLPIFGVNAAGNHDHLPAVLPIAFANAISSVGPRPGSSARSGESKASQSGHLNAIVANTCGW